MRGNVGSRPRRGNALLEPPHPHRGEKSALAVQHIDAGAQRNREVHFVVPLPLPLVISRRPSASPAAVPSASEALAVAAIKASFMPLFAFSTRATVLLE